MPRSFRPGPPALAFTVVVSAAAVFTAAWVSAAFAQRPAKRPGSVAPDIDRAVERLGPKLKYIEPRPDPAPTIPSPWEETGMADIDERLGRSAIVKLRNASHATHAVWILEPEEAESDEARPWRVPLGPGETQTIGIEPGRWTVTLRAGAAGGAPLAAETQSVDTIRERAYASTLDPKLEEAFREALKERDAPLRRPVPRRAEDEAERERTR